MSNTIDNGILSNITLELSNAISFSKAKYHERLSIKLDDPKQLEKPTGQFYKHLLMVQRFH